jgi:hypothetical protein
MHTAGFVGTLARCGRSHACSWRRDWSSDARRRRATQVRTKPALPPRTRAKTSLRKRPSRKARYPWRRSRRPPPRRIAWSELEIQEAEINAYRPRTLYVTVGAETNPFPERELWGESVELRPDDGRIPEAIRELSPFILSASRAPFRIREPNAIFYAQALYGGDYWMLRFDSQGLQNPVVAVSRIVSEDIRLRAAPEPRDLSIGDPFVRVARAHLPKHWLRAFESADRRTLQVAPGTFRHGATQVVVLSYEEELSYASCMFTAAADHAFVDGLAMPSAHSGHAGITIEFLADLDGDGLEEVGWHEQDIESSARYLTHQAETGAVHQNLSSGGH